VEVRPADGPVVVLDCGTGAHALGLELVAARESRGHLLISHTHWDHIQGFPFFGPLFVHGNEWDIYAPQGIGHRLESTLSGQMEYTFFPVTLGQLAATLRYHDLAEGAFEAGVVRVTTRFMNHPGLAMGYRLECDGATVVYATDHEPHSPHRVHPEDERHVAFLSGADLVVHDAQYTLAEYPQKMTWGHTPAEQAVDFALAAGVKRLALFHHDPVRTDAEVDMLVAMCRRRVANLGGTLEVFGAAEGLVIDLGGPSRLARLDGRGEGRPALAPTKPLAPPTVLLVDDDQAVIEVLVETLEPEGFRLLIARDGDAALRTIRAEHPDLVLLDCTMPGPDGFEVCRTVREDPDPVLRAMPIVMLTALDAAEDTARGFAVGATDYLTKPFKTTHIRTRVQAWLVRAGS
jgi:CheY-like chemotaxis protein/phosphoribosyl 1,2-cyclic phosphodiesterase